MKQNSRRARIPGRSLRHSPARPSRQNPSEKPASNPKSVNFPDPISVQFSKPIDIGVHAERGTVSALGFFTPRPCGPLCRPPPGELAGGRRSLAGGAISFGWISGGDAFSQQLARGRRSRACAPPFPAAVRAETSIIEELGDMRFARLPAGGADLEGCDPSPARHRYRLETGVPGGHHRVHKEEPRGRMAPGFRFDSDESSSG